MKAAQKETYEAHVAFELERLRGAVENGFLRSEIELLWATLAKQPLTKIITKKALIEAVDRRVTTFPATKGMLDLIANVADGLINADINKSTKLGDLVTDKDRKALVKQSLSLTTLRRDLIHATVNNPLYSDTVADLLYHGIRDYVSAGSEITKKVPGMGSLMNRGGDFLNKRIEGLEGKIEEKVRGYISSNMHKILGRSEAMLQDSLTAEQLAKISDEVWGAAKNLPPRIDGYVTKKDITAFTKIGSSIWLHLRDTEYFKALLSGAVAEIYGHAGKKQLATWLAELGIEPAWLIDEIELQWPVLFPALENSGYLEKVTRARLEPFYAQL